MKVEFWQIGKTSFPYLEEGIKIYEKRLKHYLPFERVTITDIKNSKNRNPDQIKELEGNEVLKKLHSNDFLLLFDENGKSYSSAHLAKAMEKWLQLPNRKLIFLIGGAYGFPEKIYRRAQAKVSLSALTFSHQMVRLFIMEQLYRSMTILRGEPYHHE